MPRFVGLRPLLTLHVSLRIINVVQHVILLVPRTLNSRIGLTIRTIVRVSSNLAFEPQVWSFGSSYAAGVVELDVFLSL